ncbi:MoxR-like ATPase [Sulfuritortus calidifontis]|uniref:MoxR-like ATPase n=1 Tax=Sulfuritortus calidifontis TaxID=1914471 RepID=A0A4R3K097_9PROT|nr:MoxR family ATPase [Sulfuritortus calidifontis]TCS72996.1 MoxR-like ATPase [Sulfuritortus calidifontis]
MKTELAQALAQINRVVLGKEHQVRLCLACLLARGHLLIEDTPGVGKTTLAHTLAVTLGLQFHRIQFTSDLLPADLLGAAIYDRERGSFSFHPGPIFAQVILADEINRASPKSQSALLEAMEEGRVTIEGETRELPKPFFVIATQNPVEQAGVFPLPESQLDRFLMRIRLGYPDHAAERALLRGENRRDLLAQLAPVLDPAGFIALQQAVQSLHVSEALLDYVQALIDTTRRDLRFAGGLSPRAGLALLHAAQGWAYLDGRDFVQPEDIQAVLGPVVGHRLHPASGIEAAEPEWAAQVLMEVAIP